MLKTPALSLVAVLIGISFQVSAQFINLTVKLSVLNDKLRGATLVLYQNGKVIETVHNTGPRFHHRLHYSREYVLEFKKDGCVTKQISINTKGVPKSAKEFPQSIRFAVEIERVPDNAPMHEYAQPVAHYFFQKKADDFVYNINYTKKDAFASSTSGGFNGVSAAAPASNSTF